MNSTYMQLSHVREPIFFTNPSSLDVSSTLTGGCHCGGCHYTIDPQTTVDTICFCHCHTCQRLSGSAALPFFKIPKSSFKWDSSDSLTEVHASDTATRTFCNRCGSPLSMFFADQPDKVHLTCGSLDPELGPRLKQLNDGSDESKQELGHIFTSEKALWHAA